MLKIKSTVIPKEKRDRPYSNPNMVYIIDYWSQSRCNFNHKLYLKVLMSKKENF